MLDFEIDEKGELIIVHFVGYLTMDSISKITINWDEIFNSCPSQIGLNFSRLDRIDSLGINYLIKLKDRASCNQAYMVIYDVNPLIERILKISRLDKLFKIISSKQFQDEFLL